MGEWSELVLGDSLELLIDNRGRNPEFSQTGIPLLSGQSIKETGIDLAAVRYVSDDTYRQWMPHPVRKGDLILTSEAPLGRAALVRTDHTIALGQRIFGMRGADGILDTRFLYYSFQTAAVQRDLTSRATGTTVVGIRNPELRKIRIPAPPFEEQRSIAEVLGALDDKIAANDRLADSAAQLMVALASTAPEVATVADLADQSTRALKPETFDDVVAQYSLPAFDVGQMPELSGRESIKSNKFALDEPCVLISKLNPRIPRIWDVCVLPEQMAVGSTEFVTLVPGDVSTSCLWSALSAPAVSTDLQGLVAGTSGSHQRVKPAELLGLTVRDPRTLATSVQDGITALGAVVHARRLESAGLAAARDELLPLLMSGKLRVAGAAEFPGTGLS